MATSQIASLVANVFSNTAVAEDKVKQREFFLNPKKSIKFNYIINVCVYMYENF